MSLPLRDEPDYQDMRFDRFLNWFDERWAQGQHVAFVGPTGTGKTTLAVHLADTRHWVMALDAKGGDRTLGALRRRGFERVTSWPPPRPVMRRIQEGEPVRLIVGGIVETRADLPKLRATIARALDDAFDMGGWTVLLDELQITADRRLMNLSGSIERLLVSARSKGVSMMTCYQRPANVPRAAGDQSTWFVVWFTRDTDVVARLGEMAGRPRAEMRGLMRALGSVRHAVAVFSNDPSQPVVLTKAPRV